MEIFFFSFSVFLNKNADRYWGKTTEVELINSKCSQVIVVNKIQAGKNEHASKETNEYRMTWDKSQHVS